jgi:hypothetical protein
MAAKRQDSLRAQIGPFVVLPCWVLDRCTDGRAIQLYAVLTRYANREGRAWPSRTQLLEALAVAPRSLDRALAELKRIGALQTELRHRADGAVDGADYLLIQVEPPAAAAETEAESHIATDGEKAEDNQIATDGEKADADHFATGGGQAAAFSPPVPDHFATGGDANKGRTRSTELDPSTKDLSTAAPPTSQNQTLLDVYHDAFVHRFGGIKPNINGAKDGKLLKVLSDSQGEATVRQLLGWFFRIRDPFIAQSGFTVGVFYACFNKLLITYRPPEPTGDNEAAAVLREMRERGDRQRTELEKQARAAIIALPQSARAELRRLVVQQFQSDYPGMVAYMASDAYERALKGAAVRYVVEDMCRGGKPIAEVMDQFARSYAA